MYRYAKYFLGGVYWLEFASPSAVPTEVAACGGADGLNLHPDFDNLPLDERVKRVSSFFKSPLPKLLVFNNCEDSSLLEAWHPKQGGSHVLVTSRKDDWPTTLGITRLPLGKLSRDESIDLLQKYCSELEGQRENFDAIAEELGDLPLALHLAGNFLNSYRHSPLGEPTNYLSQLRSQALLEHPSLQGFGSVHSPTGSEPNVAKTFALSYDQLRTDDPVDEEALQLLARAADFALGEAIPRELLVETLDFGNEQAKSFEQLIQTENALRRLTGLGLLERELGGELKVHRLIAAFVQGLQNEDGSSRPVEESPSTESAPELDVFSAAMNFLRMVRPYPTAQAAVEETLLRKTERINSLGSPLPLLAWQSHLRYVTDTALRREGDLRWYGGETAARLAFNLGDHLYQAGDFLGAKTYQRQVLAMFELGLGIEVEYIETAIFQNNYGMTLCALGEYKEAEPYLRKALCIREHEEDPEPADLSTSLNNYGMVLHWLGKSEEAEPYYTRALQIRTDKLGSEHCDTATSQNNLGFLYHALGRYEEAEPLLEQALSTRRKKLRSKHPDIAETLSNLGGLFFSLKKYEKSKTQHEEALEIRKQELGLTHIRTAESWNNLAITLYMQKEFNLAKTYLEQALPIFEKTFGATHPDTKMIRENLYVLIKLTTGS